MKLQKPNYKNYYISLFLAFVILLSLLPAQIVTGDISSEFYSPLGSSESWSFEYNGNSVLQPPPGWTVSGGMRFLSTDLNGDGVCNETDLEMFLLEYGNDPGYDFDGDGHCSWYDLVIISKTLKKSKTSFHGDYCWFIGGFGDWFMERNVETFCLSAMENTRFAFGFWYKGEILYNENGSVRAEVIVHYSTKEETFQSPWYALYDSWALAHVEANAGSGIQWIKVKIVIRDAEVFIDSTMLCLIKTIEKSNSEGTYSLGLNIFSYKVDAGLPMDALVRSMPSIHISSSTGWFIKWVKLKVKIISHGGESGLKIWYASQGNDKGWIVNPETAEQELQNELFATSIVISFITSISLIWGVGWFLEAAEISGWTGVLIRATASTTVGALVKYALPHLVTHPQQTEGNEVWAQLDYPTFIGPVSADDKPENWFVQSMNCLFDLSWAFKTASSSAFEIQVEATYCLAQAAIVFIIQPGVSGWFLVLGDPYASEVQYTTTLNYLINA